MADGGTNTIEMTYEPGPPAPAHTHTKILVTWGPTGDGQEIKTHKCCTETEGPTTVPRPPLYCPLPWESCTLNKKRLYDEHKDYVFTWKRDAQTTLALYTGDRGIGKPNAVIIASAQAWDYMCELPNIPMAVQIGPGDVENPDLLQGSPVQNNKVSLLGSVLDPCNSRVWAVLPNNSLVTKKATPKVETTKWYGLGASAGRPKLVTLSRCWHKNFNGKPPALQPGFDQASLLLAKDDDGCIPDDDPSLNDVAKKNADDVHAFYEFWITENPDPTKNVFPLTGNAFYEIEIRDNAVIVCGDETANIKQVKSMRWDNNWIPGIADWSGAACNVVYAGKCCPAVLLHEWIHTCGVAHRGEKVNGVILNPGPTAAAIMKPLEDEYANEINRTERAKIELRYP